MYVRKVHSLSSKHGRIEIIKVARAIERHKGITVKELFTESRVPPLPYYRWMTMHIVKQRYGRDFSLEAIAIHMGLGSHCAVLYGIRKFKKIISEDQTKKEEINEIKRIYFNS